MSLTDTINVTSLVLNVILTIISVGLAVANWKDAQKKNDQVKIWMEQANGISVALQRIIQDKWQGLYSSVNDITNAVYVAQASAFSLYQSLYEERILSEKEVKEHQKRLRALLDKKLDLEQDSTTPTTPRQRSKKQK